MWDFDFTPLIKVKVRFVRLRKNLTNGDVEVVASGEMSRINELALWLESGPKTSNVKSVAAKEIDFEDHTGFEIL